MPIFSLTQNNLMTVVIWLGILWVLIWVVEKVRNVYKDRLIPTDESDVYTYKDCTVIIDREYRFGKPLTTFYFNLMLPSGEEDSLGGFHNKDECKKAALYGLKCWLKDKNYLLTDSDK